MENKPTSEEWKNIISFMERNVNNQIYIGDKFGQYFFEHFMNCLPPLLLGSDNVLCSEPYSTIDGEDTYVGIYQNRGTWFGIITTELGFNVVLESRKKENNPDRTRYYGLCIGDKVKVMYGSKQQTGIVNNFSSFDNNRVQLQVDGKEICSWIAEHCEIIEKYDNDRT